MIFKRDIRLLKNFIPLDTTKRANNFKNKTGLTFGRLRVKDLIGYYHDTNAGKKHLVYECLCSCGKVTSYRSSDLVTGNAMSCGCLKKEQTILFNKRTKTKVYRCTINAVYQSYKCGAKKRSLDFEIDQKYLLSLSQMDCFYCGIEPKQIRKARGKLSNYYYNGIDRLDNTKGYTKDNMVPCCGTCNKMKSNQTLESFYKKIEDIYNKKVKLS